MPFALSASIFLLVFFFLFSVVCEGLWGVAFLHLIFLLACLLPCCCYCVSCLFLIGLKISLPPVSTSPLPLFACPPPPLFCCLPFSFPQWLRDPGPRNEKRTLFCDMVCFLFITPLAAISGWLCLRGAQDHLQLGSWLQAVGLIALTIALFTIYVLWTLVNMNLLSD